MPIGEKQPAVVLWAVGSPAAVIGYGSVSFPLCVVQPSPVPSGRGLLELMY